jgi:hypothetical protein
VSALRYPGIFQLAGAGIVLVVTVLMLLGYAACGVLELRRPAAGSRTGLICGLLAGALWSAEIWCGGPAKLGRPAAQALGASFLLMAVAVTVLSGAVTARTGRAGAAWRAGLFSGLVSGVIVYSFGVIMTLSTLPILASRSDYQAQFASSHAPSMTVFLVGDILTAVAAHLVINLALGVLGGAVGRLSPRAPRRLPAD